MSKSKLNILVLGAGFGGLELSTILSEKIGENLDLILIDKNDSFFFGFSKLDVMFGRKLAGSVRYRYHNIKKPGVKFHQEKILSLDPIKRSVLTDKGSYYPDVLVIALGADYDLSVTPGLEEGGNEFYSYEGAREIGRALLNIDKGDIIVGACSMPFKCPPAPSEAALLLDEYLTKRGVRKSCRIHLIVPFELPIPPSYGTSKALLKAFTERKITYYPEMMVESIDPGRKTANLYDGSELPFDMFMGIPEHVVPEVASQTCILKDEWIPVDKNTMRTKHPGVYAIGDITSVGTPKAGLFAESAAKIAAESIISEYRNIEYAGKYTGAGPCYIEFGSGKVGRSDVDFFSGPIPGGTHNEASTILSHEKREYYQKRKIRWFGE